MSNNALEAVGLAGLLVGAGLVVGACAVVATWLALLVAGGFVLAAGSVIVWVANARARKPVTAP